MGQAKSKKRIIIAGGGTAGHVRPGQFIGHGLSNWDKYWFGNHDSIESRIIAKDEQFEFIGANISPLRGRSFTRKVLALFRLLLATSVAIRTLRRYKPDMVLGTGGYVAVPLGVAAWVLNIKLVVHESNAVPGMGNKLLGRLADRVLVGFPQVWSSRLQHKTVHVGNPVDPRLYEIGDQESLTNNQGAASIFNLLIIGGSLGAEVFNETMPGVGFSELGELCVWHQCGRDDLVKGLQASYAQKNIPARVFAFADDMPSIYVQAHAIICRAGAMTCAEVALLGVPTLLVPYPHAVDDHQTKNAQSLQKSQTNISICQQKDFSHAIARQWLQFAVGQKTLAKGKAAAAKPVVKIIQVIEALVDG